MFLFSRRVASMAALAALAGALFLPRAIAAQTTSFEACSQGALADCATVQLTSQLGIGPGGLNLFQIAIQNMGSQTTPSLATSIYFLEFVTTQPPVEPGGEVDALATPTAVGGATVSDASDWSVFESGDAIFLSALGNTGVGGCASAPAVDGGIGQMGQTCGSDQFITFSFFTSRAFDTSALTLADVEFAGVAPGSPSDSCNDLTPCAISHVTTTPEPSSIILMLTGLTGIAGVRWRRRRVAAVRALTPSEA